jgi:hypothetical protein
MIFLGALAASGAATAAPVSFGPSTFQSDEACAFTLTDDKFAFELKCSDLQVVMDPGKLPENVRSRVRAGAAKGPVAMRAVSVVIPTTSKERVRLPISLEGFVLTEAGARATLLFVVNGETTVVKFPPKSDRSYVKNIVYRAKSASDVRLTAVLITERETATPGAAAFLGLSVVRAGNLPK